MDEKLTPKQQAFFDGLLAGKTQYQAFIDAGYRTEGKSRNYIDKEASLLAKNRKIRVRLENHKKEVAEELMKKDLWTKEDSIRTLKWLIGKSTQDIDKKGVRAANQQATVSAIKEINSILGIGADIELKIEAHKQAQEKDTEEASGWLEALEQVATEHE